MDNDESREGHVHQSVEYDGHLAALHPGRLNRTPSGSAATDGRIEPFKNARVELTIEDDSYSTYEWRQLLQLTNRAAVVHPLDISPVSVRRRHLHHHITSLAHTCA